jgi:hypothetical protein
MKYDLAYLDGLIRDAIEESYCLEYKAADALKKGDSSKKEIAKDVSSIANANGGIIIYGISEDRNNKHLPERIDSVNCREYSKEWLDRIINQISPKIEGLIIHPVKTCDDDTSYAYVVEIPKSTTAHQNLYDYKYYRRRNFQAEPMPDYEVREVMNRAIHPILDLKIIIITQHNNMHIGWKLLNNSPIMARHYAVVLKIPISIAHGDIYFDQSKTNAMLNTGAKAHWSLSVSNNLGSPIFPGATQKGDINFNIGQLKRGKDDCDEMTNIEATIFADNSPRLTLTKELNDVLKGWA